VVQHWRPTCQLRATSRFARLNIAIEVANDAGENVSGQLFCKILSDEDHHVDYLEGQLHIINDVGLGNYLAQQIRP
jgi:bacterioferritin